MVYLTVLLILPALVLLQHIIRLVTNYNNALKTGLPFVISPVDPMNPVWVISQKLFLPLIKHLPFGLGAFTRYSVRGWVYYDKYKMHAELGDAWINVTPGENMLFIADPDVANDVFSRRKDFVKPLRLYKMLELFGPNVDTLEGPDWQRHRKITAPPFNERNSRLVWNESLRQAKGMLEWWTNPRTNGFNSTDQDTRILSMHVLTCAGLGMSYSYESAMEPADPNSTVMDYRDALFLILDQTLLAVGLPHRLLTLPLVPKKWAKVAQAVTDFKRHMTNILEKERRMMSVQELGSENLMSSLVRGSEEARRVTDNNNNNNGNASHQGGLRDDEILGNIFIYNFAGHETTGNVLSYSIHLLAAHPEVQDWIGGEINHYLDTHKSSSTWTYEELFPKLKRCLAIMHETLRLFPPVTGIPKYTSQTPQLLTISSRKHLIPSHTMVIPQVLALHTHPTYWSPDPLVWRPSRWIVPFAPRGHDHRPTDEIESETLKEPQRGTFLPWSEGAHVCPGKKFSQVEFVAVMAVLFRTHRVRPILREGETEAQARERVQSVVEDSAVRMTLQMKDPGRVRVRWVLKEDI